MSQTLLAERSVATSSRAANVVSHDDDSEWKRAAQAANAAFRRSDHETARKEYHRALHIAERLLSRPGQTNGAGAVPAFFVASHHGLAEVARAQGQTALALEHFETAFDQMLGLAQSKSTPPALREACAAQLQPSLTALATHMMGCGAPLRAIRCAMRRARLASCN